MRARRERRRTGVPAVQRHAHGDRGQPRARAPHDGRRREALLRAVLDRGAPAGRTRSSRPRSTCSDTSHFWRTWLAEGTYPDHPWRYHLQRSALALKGLTFMPTGALVAAPTTSLPETPRRRTQLGLPLLLDARRDLHAVGAARARPRLGGRRLHPVRRRHGAQRGRLAADHVRHQGPEGPRRVDARPPHGLRGRAAGAHRQRRLSTSARTTSTAPCSTRCTCTPSAATTSPSACGRCSATRSNARRATGASPTRGSGRRAGPAPLRLLEADVLGRAGPRRAPGRTARPRRRRGAAGRRSPMRSAPRSSSAASTGAACSASTTTPTRSTPRACSSRSCASCRPRTSACARP